MHTFTLTDVKKGYRIITKNNGKCVEVGYFVRLPYFDGWQYQTAENKEKYIREYESRKQTSRNYWKELQREYIHSKEQADTFITKDIDFMVFENSNNIELSEQELKYLHLLMKLKQCEDVFVISDKKFEPVMIEGSEPAKYYSNIHEKNFYDFMIKNDLIKIRY